MQPFQHLPYLMSSQGLSVSCQKYFQELLPAQQYNSWIKPLSFEVDGKKIILTAPNSFTLRIIQERFLAELSKQANDFFGFPAEIEFRLQKRRNEKKDLPPLPLTPAESIPLSSARPHKTSNKLNPLLTFDSFVTGKANQLAHAAGLQVAENPGATYNPLFIYGGVGLGKTHLLHSIGNLVAKENPTAKICYIHATNYVSGVVKAFQTKSFDEFKQFYNSLDLLLIDDIQFIADKPGTQQEFFYTLNSLIDTNKQVVISCDTFPKEISGIEPRLTSRFTCGLTVAIEPPGLEMRVAILLQKAANSETPINEDVAFFIAKHVRSNIRELEGALNRIEAYARFHKKAISVDLAKEALKDLLAAQNKQVTIDNIQKTVADFYRMKLVDLLSKKRTRAIARPRQIAMALARELTQLSLPEIGNSFGGRDHTTVLHACKTIDALRNNDTTVEAEFNLLHQTLRG
jgi:chromosomal replication initiator protein